MAERITIDELKSYLWQSAVLLRTHIDAGAYKQYIFPLLFFKRICDVYDEETTKAEEEYGEDMEFYPEEELHTFLVPKGYHWNDVRQVTEDVGAAIVKAFREIEKANGDKMTGIFGDGAWTNKNRLPDRLLKDLLEHFSSKCLSLANCPEDELGQGYEYLIKQFADDSGHTAQEFYTNRTVVHLMTEMLQPQSGESVYDPTCGSAGMLIMENWLIVRNVRNKDDAPEVSPSPAAEAVKAEEPAQDDAPEPAEASDAPEPTIEAPAKKPRSGTDGSKLDYEVDEILREYKKP